MDRLNQYLDYIEQNADRWVDNCHTIVGLIAMLGTFAYLYIVAIQFVWGLL